MPRASFARVAGVALALAVVGALAAMSIALWHRAQVPIPADALASRQLYGLTLDDADGHAQPLSQWRGKLLVVNFWATWCAPCVAEMPELDRLQQEFSPREVAIVGIGVESRERVRQFRDQLGLHITLLAGGFDSLSLARTFGDEQGVLPYTALLSADGRVLHARAGALRPGELRAWLSASR